MLSSRSIQRLFFYGTCGVALYFTVRLGVALSLYFPLQSQAHANVSRWEVNESGDRFSIHVNYSFEADGKIWKQSRALGPTYYCEAAAIAALKERAQKPIIAWYNRKNPSFSSLEKDFPASLLFRMLICYGVIIYFIFLNKKLKSIDLLD